MRRRRVALGALLLTLLVGSSLYVGSGLWIYANFRAAYGPYALSCNGMLAWDPPTALYAGVYDNQASFVTVRVRASAPALARVTVQIPGFSMSQTIETQAGSTFQPLSFKPQLTPAATLDQFSGQNQASAQILAIAQVTGNPPCQVSAKLTVFSRQWMIWRDPASHADTTPYIAGWVTPQAPRVAELVGRAAQRLRIHPELYDDLPVLFGYDEGRATAGQVRDQVDAIFDVLQSDYHLRYSADNPPFTTTFSQVVQAPDDVLGSAAPSGMCVETTVVMASAVERLGMRAYIVFTATHAYLGVALGAGQGAPLSYWETSDLGGSTLGSQANVDGDAEYTKDQSSHAITEVVDIAYERARGIEPNH